MSTAITELFQSVSDPRVARTRVHPLESILYIVLCGSLAGIHTWIGFEDYASEHIDVFKEIVDLPNGVPSHDTIARVISALNVEEFSQCFDNFTKRFQEQIQEKRSKDSKGIIAIDGKTMRGTSCAKTSKKAIHIVSAWASDIKLCLAQVKTEKKSNEITAIPELLKMLDLRGQVVTIDAMGCQRNICEKILDGEADYVISLKGNQGLLHEDIKTFFEDIEVQLTHEWKEYDKGHGRIESRHCLTTDDTSWLNDHSWPGLKSVAVVRSSRKNILKGTMEYHARYYISSLNADAERIAKAAREHWGIENEVHYILDVSKGEDKTRISVDNAPEILSLMNKWALNIVKHNKGKDSVKRAFDKIKMNPKRIVNLMTQI